MLSKIIKKRFSVYFLLLPVILVLGIFFISHNSYAVYNNCSLRITNCPSSAVSDSYTIEARITAGEQKTKCPKGSPCTYNYDECMVGQGYTDPIQYQLDGGGWRSDIDDEIPVTFEQDCNCQCSPNCTEGIRAVSRALKTVSGSGVHTIKFKSIDNCSNFACTDSCTQDFYFTKSFRHENCCDNWGWNGAERCGGCCGPAENCVG